MQVNAINYANSLNRVNFEGKKKKGVSRYAAPAAAAAIMLSPAMVQSCKPISLDVSAKAKAIAMVMIPRDSICCRPGKDTVIIEVPKTDTLYLDKGFNLDKEVQDSLNIWRGDYVDIDAKGDEDNPGSHKNQVLMSLSGLRDWEYRRPEYINLDLAKSNSKETVYNHVYLGEAGLVDGEIKVKKVNAGDVTVVGKDGKESSKVTGLMFDDGEHKVFAHSNGRDSIYVFKQITDGANKGKFESAGKVAKGYLPKDGGTPNTKYGQNILLESVLADGTEDHFVQVNARAMNYDALKDLFDQLED